MTYAVGFVAGVVVTSLVWWIKAKGKANVVGDVEKAAADVEKKV